MKFHIENLKEHVKFYEEVGYDEPFMKKDRESIKALELRLNQMNKAGK
jgi:protoheme ferro-lyase